MGRGSPDYWTATGGQIDEVSQKERRSTILNDSGIVNGVVPPAFHTGPGYYGKFYTRGCRGMIEEIQIYCVRTAAGTLRLAYSPHPCLGPLYTVTITPGATWAWVGAAIEEMWNYDSLYIWIDYIGLDVSWAYDAVLPYDGHLSDDAGVTWADLATRPFIRVVYSGETPGDVPVSGIINNIPIPSASSRVEEHEMGVLSDTETPVVWVYGAGYCDYIEVRVEANTNSHLTDIRVWCDGVLSMEENYEEMEGYLFTPMTPTVSLSAYDEDGECVMLIHKRFEFRRSIAVLAYNLPTAQTVTGIIHPTLMR